MNYNRIEDILSLIENKIANTYGRWLGIKAVSKYTSLSESTIHRAIIKCELKVLKRIGKLLFNVNDVDRWLNG